MPAAKVTSVVEDLSTRVNSNSTYNTAIVVAAPKGPINKPVKVSSQTSFLRTFTPYERIELGWDTGLFEAYKYLDTQNGLYIVRAANVDTVKAAVCLVPLKDGEDLILNGLSYKDFEALEQDDAITINNSTEEAGEPSVIDLSNYACIIYASSPSVYGNDIKLQIITNQEQVRVAGAFIIKIFVRGIQRETFTVSLSKTVKDGYGSNCYIKDVLESSQYIRAYVPDGTADEKVYEYTLNRTYKIEDEDETYKITLYSKENVKEIKQESFDLFYYDKDGERQDFNLTETEEDAIKDNRLYFKDFYMSPYLTEGSNAVILYSDLVEEIATERTKNFKIVRVSNEPVETTIKLPKEYTGDDFIYLKGGSNGNEVTIGNRITALNTLGNMKEINIQLIMDGDITDEAYHRAIKNITSKRKDSCHGIISTRFEDEKKENALTAITNYRKYQLNMNSYSMEMYTPHQKYYDEFNDRYMWLSPGPFVAAKIMEVAQERGWHWAVAGYNRGIIDSIDVYKAFEDGDVDEFSDMQVNTIIKDPGSGNVIWDELTLWNQASDLQDAHISRWINIYLRPALEDMLKSFLFEFNDEETRNLIVKKIETFMEPQKSARACYAYRVICDETNNTDDDIENNRLNSWLYIKPTKIAKWITQRIIITPYSTQLEDLEF